MARPALRVEYSHTEVRNSTLASSMAKNPTAYATVAALATATVRFSNRVRSMAGAGWTLARRTATTASPAAATRRPTTAGLVHPHSSLCVIPRASDATATDSSATPTRSGGGPPTTDSSTTRRVTRLTTTSTGRLMRKAHRQPPSVDEHGTERRAGRDGEGGDATPHGHGLSPQGGGGGVEEQGEGRGHQEGGADGLHDPSADEHPRGGGGAAEERSEREDGDAAEEPEPPAGAVGDASGAEQQGAEHHAVGGEHPRQLRGRRPGERRLDRREGHVHDRQVEGHHEGAGDRHQEHRPRDLRGVGVGVRRQGSVASCDPANHLALHHATQNCRIRV